MRSLRRAGFTLVELLIGLVVLVLFAGLIVTLVHGAGRVASRSLSDLAIGRTTLSLQSFLQQELRDAVDTDVAPIAPTRLGVLRPIGEVMPCADSAGALIVADTAWHGTRAPQAGRDIALLLTDPVAELWLSLGIDSVATAQCPADHAPAIRLNLAPHAGVAAIVRILEPVEFSAYRSGTFDWFGLTPADHSAVVQPFAGPLAPGTTRFTWSIDHLDIAFTLPATPSRTTRLPLELP